MYFLNKLIVFIIILSISSIVSIALISICEFKILSGGYKRDSKLDKVLCDTKENFVDKKTSKKISVEKDRTVKFKQAICLFVEDDNVKKDVFVKTDDENILIVPGKHHTTNKKCKVKAFYYDEPYDIFYNNNME